MIYPQRFSGPAPASANDVSKRRRLVNTVAGLVYLVFTLGCGAWFVYAVGPSMQNFHFWPLYDALGYDSYMIHMLNIHLTTAQLGVSEPLVLDMPFATTIRPTFQETYIRRVLFTELNTLPRAIHDIRASTINGVRDVYAQYCWVDLGRRWDIAHTKARATRCLANYTHNAAVHMEAILRNVIWRDYVEVVGDGWHSCIAAEVARSSQGLAWLRDRDAHVMLSVDAEVAYLASHGLTAFDWQWHNEYRMGISELVQVENALGVHHPVTLKTSDLVGSTWRSVVLYWNFRNDVAICHEYNVSLVRGAPNHANSVFGEDMYSRTHLPSGGNTMSVAVAFIETIGALGSVDALYEPVPPSLLALYNAFMADYNSVVRRPDPQLAPNNSLSFFPLPPNFPPDGDYLGGNPLCLSKSFTTYPQAQLLFDDSCAGNDQLKFPATPVGIDFALVASGVADATTVCAIELVDPAFCRQMLALAMARLLDTTPPSETVQSAVARAMTEVPPIFLVQYGMVDDAFCLLQEPLVSPHDERNFSWHFYGWLALFDWVQGRREVIRLDGDVASLRVISEVYPPLELASAVNNETHDNGTAMVFFFVLYTSAMALAIGGVSLVYALLDLPHFAGRNMFVFNRVVGFTWVGRPLLLLRGVCAILVLSTAQTHLVHSADGHTRFQFQARSVLETMVLAGECAWLAYSVTDILLLLPRVRARVAAPLSSVAAWAATVALDLTYPVQMQSLFDRDCNVDDIGHYLHCSSGVVQVGDVQRAIALVAVQAACVGAALLLDALVGYRRYYRRSRSAPLLLHGTAEAFLVDHHHDEWHLDRVTCVICGLVPFSWRGKQYTFDIKLWVIVHHQACVAAHRVSMQPVAHGRGPPAMPAAIPRHRSSRWSPLRRTVKVGIGFAYLGLSAFSSVTYLIVSNVNLANDFYWATFNLTGHHVMLASWFSNEIDLDTPPSVVRLDDDQWGETALNVSNPVGLTRTSPRTATRMQFEKLSGLMPAIRGLRASNPCSIPWIMTQYCWVDVQRRWPMANSPKRQVRCLDQSANGAVYLETVLRNVVRWGEFERCWGAAFDVAFRTELSATIEGRAWLTMAESPPVPEADEAMYLGNAGIAHFTVQWQNYKSTGLVNRYRIENAVGMLYDMTLLQTNGSYRWPSWTSHIMYWGFASDLAAVSSNESYISGHSLIRGSANFAFENTTMTEVLAGNGTLRFPLYEAYSVVDTEIGPFGSVDMMNVPCPASVKALMAAVLSSIRRQVRANATSHASYFSILRPRMLRLVRLPPGDASHGWLTYGSNLLCPENPANDATFGTHGLTSRTQTCFQAVLTNFCPSVDMLLTALFASFQSGDVGDALQVCTHSSNQAECGEFYLATTVPFMVDHMESDAFADAALNVSIMQYMRPDVTEWMPLELHRFNLFDPTVPTFDVWSWVLAMEWAYGQREVVQFQGDAGSITIVTELDNVVEQAVHQHELVAAFSIYARGTVQYVTGVMMSIAVMVLVFGVCSRGHIEGSNMTKLNRVAGLVWVGRPLLLVRGVTALCLLSTATLELQVTHGITSFVVPPVPWYKTVLSASEATWLVYILNDICMVWTQHVTLSYATTTSLLVWVIAAAVTLAWPVDHEVRVHPECYIDEMDFQLVCNSGTVVIGRSSRLVFLIGVVGVANVVCYVVARRSHRHAAPDTAGQPLLLSSGAAYLFQRHRWVHEGTYYIDPASAFLAGLVSYRWGQTVHVLDIKLWRLFAIDLAANPNIDHVQHAIPLRQ